MIIFLMVILLLLDVWVWYRPTTQREEIWNFTRIVHDSKKYKLNTQREGTWNFTKRVHDSNTHREEIWNFTRRNHGSKKYKLNTQREGTWNNTRRAHDSHIVTYKLSSHTHYSSPILDHEFPNCQNRNIYNGNASYSLPDILKFIRKYIPPPTDFVSYLKNPCWYGNYDKEMSAANWKLDYSTLTDNFSYLLPKNNSAKKMYCLPYVYLLGYPKCGTSSLYEYFKIHPEFATISTRGCGWIGQHTSGLVDKYPANVRSVFHLLDHFYLASRQVELSSSDHHIHNKIITDFSPATSWRQRGFQQHKGGSMCDPPLLLKELQPNAKFIALLREPVDRLYSAFWFYPSDRWRKKLSPKVFAEDVQTYFERLKQCDKSTSMLECLKQAEKFHHHFQDFEHVYSIEQIRTGFYYLYLLPWLQVFPRKNFFFIRTEDMKKDTGKIMQEIFKFLGMSSLQEEKLNVVVKNTVNFQAMLHSSNSTILLSSSAKKLLRAYFRPFNEKLSELLNDSSFLWEDVD